MKRRAGTKADIEKQIDQCNRRLGLISDNLNELKAARADLENWQRNLSLAEQDRLSLSAICPAPDRQPSATARRAHPRQPQPHRYASAGLTG
jgi:hypothetical protein